MMSRSRSSHERALAVLLAAICACKYEDDERRIALSIDEAAGAALRVVVGVRGQYDAAYVGLRGELRNLGAEPCHVAIYQHFAEPTPADLPLLAADAAPSVIGADGHLLMESVLLPPADGRTFVRVFPDSGFGLDTTIFSLPGVDDYVYGLSLNDQYHESDVRVWVSLATCADPQVQADLGVMYGANHVNEVDIAALWP